MNVNSPKYDECMEKALKLNLLDMNRVRRGFTGQSLVHWIDGEPTNPEEFDKIKLSAEKVNVKKQTL